MKESVFQNLDRWPYFQFMKFTFWKMSKRFLTKTKTLQLINLRQQYLSKTLRKKFKKIQIDNEDEQLDIDAKSKRDKFKIILIVSIFPSQSK